MILRMFIVLTFLLGTARGEMHMTQEGQSSAGTLKPLGREMHTTQEGQSPVGTLKPLGRGMHTTQEGIALFEEFIDFKKSMGSDVIHVSMALAELYGELGADDFNETMFYIFDRYYEEPTLREDIFQFLDGNLKDVMKPVLFEQEHDYWHWKTLKGMVDGVFLLTAVRMAVRLGGVKASQALFRKLFAMLPSGKTVPLNMRALAVGGPGKLSHFKTWLRGFAEGDWRRQYVMAAALGGLVSSESYVRRSAHRRINPWESLYAINRAIVLEAALLVCHARANPEALEGESVKKYLAQLTLLQGIDPRLKNGIPWALLEDSLKVFGNLFPDRRLSLAGECFSGGEGQIYLEAVLSELKKLSSRGDDFQEQE